MKKAKVKKEIKVEVLCRLEMKVEESPSLVGSWTSKRARGEARSGMEDRFHGSGLYHYYITTPSSAFARLSSTSHVY